MIDPRALFYDRALRLATASVVGLPIEKLILAAILVLPLWKGAHHVRSLHVDFGGTERNGIVETLPFAIALLRSVMGIAPVVGL